MTDDAVARLHRGLQLEDAAHALVERWLRRRGGRVVIFPYTGYGTVSWIRVMARVRLSRPDAPRAWMPGRARPM